MTTFTGSNSERQSVGQPGHCDDCADRGHVAAHPDLGCSDVGCHSVHPEEPESAPQVPVAPQVALVVHGRDADEETLNESHYIPGGWSNAVPEFVRHLRREAGHDAGPVPTGWLYTATGAHRLDDVLTHLWFGRVHEMDRVWADFVTSIGSAAGASMTAQDKA